MSAFVANQNATLLPTIETAEPPPKTKKGRKNHLGLSFGANVATTQNDKHRIKNEKLVNIV